MKIQTGGLVQLALLLIAATGLFADPITYTYTYTGNNYGPCCAPYNSSMHETASLTLSAPLGPNLVDRATGPLSFSLNDGYMTTNNLTPHVSPPFFYVYTDSSGNIKYWLLFVDVSPYTSPVSPFTTSGYQFESISCGPCSTVPLEGSIFGSSHDHVGLDPDIPTEDVGYVQSNPGSWSETIGGLPGGVSSAPALLLGGVPISGIIGSIGGDGSQAYYTFDWAGGAFSASAALTGASFDASYSFTEGVAGSCNSLANVTLDSSTGFTGTVSQNNLAPGQYCIGLDTNNLNDPAFALTFNTPVQGAVPEPSTLALLSVALGIVAASRRRSK